MIDAREVVDANELYGAVRRHIEDACAGTGGGYRSMVVLTTLLAELITNAPEDLRANLYQVALTMFEDALAGRPIKLMRSQIAPDTTTH